VDAHVEGSEISRTNALAAEHEERGLASDAAPRQARFDLGGVEAVKQQVRDVRRGATVDAPITIMARVGRTSRSLRRSLET
jgi:hypothetical protein